MKGGGKVKNKNIRNNSKRIRKGFTLVELIAVIAILGILAVIIVPSVANRSAQAEKTKNLANLKTIAQAVEMYNTENTSNMIESATTIKDMKGYLIPVDAGKTKYLSSWPVKVADLEDASTYADLLALLMKE